MATRDASYRIAGSRLRTLRKAAGFTVTSFARLLDLSPAYISSIELGRRPTVAPDTYQRICRALHIEGSPDLLQTEDLGDVVPEKPVYTLSEVAKMTGFSLRTLQADCRDKRLAHVRKGHAIAMTHAQFERLIAQCTVNVVDNEPPNSVELERRRVEAQMARESRRVAA